MNRDMLKRILAALIVIFILVVSATLFLAGHRRAQRQEAERQEEVTPTPSPKPSPTVTLTPTPSPTPSPLPTVSPTPAAEIQSGEGYTGVWYSPDGLTRVDIYDYSPDSVSFHFAQIREDLSGSCEADVVSMISGNETRFSFTDSNDSSASGELVFQGGEIRLKVHTSWQSEGSWVSPDVDCILQRERPEDAPVEITPAGSEVRLSPKE